MGGRLVPALKELQSRGPTGTTPGFLGPIARGTMTIVPLNDEERAVAAAPVPKCFQSCSWQEQTEPWPQARGDQAEAALTPLSGAGNCFETLSGKQLTGPVLIRKREACSWA